MVRLRLAISLDGFVAGPDQSADHPLGVGGMRLHDFVTDGVASALELLDGVEDLHRLTLRSTISTREVVHLQFRRC